MQDGGELTLGEAVADELGRALGWPCQARGCRTDTNGVPRNADFTEPFGCIASVRAMALCLEA